MMARPTGLQSLGESYVGPFLSVQGLFYFSNSQFVKTKYPYMEISREQLLGE